MSLKKLILFILILALSVGDAMAQTVFPVPTGNQKQLFYLQRTSNSNTIVYELNYKDGVFDLENPVHEFWIRYQEQGQQQELSFIQRKFAYGIKARKITNNKYELNFVSYKNYKLYLEPGPDNKLYVFTNINKQKVILTSIFLKINGGSFWSPNIEYVEISGIDPGNRTVVKERLKI